MRVVLLVAVALLVVPVASASDVARVSYRLEPAASWVAGKPVAVMCGQDASGWRSLQEEFLRHDDGTVDQALGFAGAGSAVIYLSPQTCLSLEGHDRGIEAPFARFSTSLRVLTHEAIHARGETDEGVTDCLALRQMAAVGIKFFGFKSRSAALRSLMAEAVRFHRLDSARYRTVC